MPSETAPVLTIVRHFEAAPERVFDAWLDPARAGKFLFATPDGEMVRVEIDAREGGQFRFTDRRDGTDVDHLGSYQVIDRPRRLVFTFSVPMYDPTVTRVTIEIRPDGGGCELTLTHEGVLPDWREQTGRGWTMILQALERAL